MNNNLDIDSLSIGVSQSGMDNYIETLLNSLFEETKKKIMDTSNVVNVINQGWQGNSRDVFLDMLEYSIESVCSNLDVTKEYLRDELQTLKKNYLSIDSHIMDGIMGDIAPVGNIEGGGLNE